jgi:serine protease Do
MNGRSFPSKRCKPFYPLIVLSLTILLWQPGTAGATARGPGVDTPSSFADLADKVQYSVVNIFTTTVVKGAPAHPFVNPDSPFRDFFGDDSIDRFFKENQQGGTKSQALGSGFIIASDGLILTNNHVVEKADEISVRTSEGAEYDAKVVGRDPKTDLALIKVTPKEGFPKPVSLGSSDAIRVGDWIIAVGNPFGLGHTVTAGIISAKGRIIGAGPYDDFLQTDAAINPGNSGGPLFNMQGEVVGISTAIMAQGQGIGFAIAINLVKQLLPQLKTGKIVRGWLGVAIQDITPDLAKAMGLKDVKGILVSDVMPGGPAEQARFKPGDVVMSVAGKEMATAHALTSTVASMEPGSKVDIQILRDGKSMALSVTIGTMPQDPGAATGGMGATGWGIEVTDVTPELAKRFGWDQREQGVVITTIAPGSEAAEAELRRGDLIKEINREKVQNVNDFHQMVGRSEKTVLLLVKRGERTFFVGLSKAGPKEGQ